MNISFKYYNKKSETTPNVDMQTQQYACSERLPAVTTPSLPSKKKKKNRGSPTRNKVNIIGKKEKKITSF